MLVTPTYRQPTTHGHHAAMQSKVFMLPKTSSSNFICYIML